MKGNNFMERIYTIASGNYLIIGELIIFGLNVKLRLNYVSLGST
jgi:hypothetical protein